MTQIIDLRDEPAFDTPGIVATESLAESLREIAGRLAEISCRLNGREVAEINNAAIALLVLADRFDATPFEALRQEVLQRDPAVTTGP